MAPIWGGERVSLATANDDGNVGWQRDAKAPQAKGLQGLQGFHTDSNLATRQALFPIHHHVEKLPESPL